MISLENLNTDQLTYLKQKWSAEIREIDLNMSRATDRLTARLERRATNSEELDLIEGKLNSAETLLAHLQSSSAPQALIDDQQAVVTELQNTFDSESQGAGVLTDEEAMLQQVQIDELALRKTYREGKIAEVEALLAG